MEVINSAFYNCIYWIIHSNELLLPDFQVYGSGGTVKSSILDMKQEINYLNESMFFIQSTFRYRNIDSV